jgi:hypothetical protein
LTCLLFLISATMVTVTIAPCVHMSRQTDRLKIPLIYRFAEWRWVRHADGSFMQSTCARG